MGNLLGFWSPDGWLQAPDASWVMVFNTDALPGHDAGAVSTGGPAKAKAVCEEKGFGGGEDGGGGGGGKEQKNQQTIVESSDWTGKNDVNCGL